MKNKEIIKVLYVCTVPTDKSGIPNVIFNLLDNLDSDRYEIGYVAINYPSNTYREKLDHKNAKLFVIPRKIINSLGYISRLSQIAKDYDIIHVHGNSATMVLEMIAARIAGVKVRIAHSHNTTCNMKAVDKLFRPLFYNLCNGRLACGIEAGKWLFKDRDFQVIKNGIDVKRFRYNRTMREKVRDRLGLSNEYVIGHIGNFVEQKNHSFLIDIFHKLVEIQPKSKLLLLGDGPLRTSIQEKVKDLGLSDKVIFAGSVDQPQNYMNAMDIVAMPSLFEGLPLTLIEEQANGLSIVVADTITTDANLSGNITYLPLSNCNQWAITIQCVLESGNHNETSSDKAIKNIQEAQYDIYSVLKNLSYQYDNLLSEN